MRWIELDWIRHVEIHEHKTKTNINNNKRLKNGKTYQVISVVLEEVICFSLANNFLWSTSKQQKQNQNQKQQENGGDTNPNKTKPNPIQSSFFWQESNPIRFDLKTNKQHNEGNEKRRNKEPDELALSPHVQWNVNELSKCACRKDSAGGRGSCSVTLKSEFDCFCNFTDECALGNR